MSAWWSATPDADGTDEWRWNRAEREGERNPAPDLRPTARRFVLLELPGLLVLGIGVSVGTALVQGQDRAGMTVGLAARWGLLVTTLGLLGFGIVHLANSGPWSNSLGVLGPGQQNRVRRQIRGSTTVADRELPVVRAAARERQATALRQAFTLVPMVSLNVTQLVNPRNEPAMVVVWLLLVLTLIAAAATGWWQYRQAATFLRMHPAPSPSAADDASFTRPDEAG